MGRVDHTYVLKAGCVAGGCCQLCLVRNNSIGKNPLHSCLTAAGVGILPAATLTTQGAADWANQHLARGIYDLLALLGSHSLLDNKQCVKNNDTSGDIPCNPTCCAVLCSCRPSTHIEELAAPDDVPLLVHEAECRHPYVWRP